MYYTEKYSPTLATASIRMLLATAATESAKLHFFEEYQGFLGTVGHAGGGDAGEISSATGRRRLFTPAFAVTIKRAQGQTLGEVDIFVP